MKVTGILSISNGAGLGYPFPVVTLNLSKLCDSVLVGVDPQFPLDGATISAMGLRNVSTVEAPWNRDNRVSGTEIALQMDRLVFEAGTRGADWVVVLQADELLHEDNFDMLRSFMDRNLSTNVHGFSMERVYFWQNLKTIRKDWNARLVRVFKPGTYSFLADGTSKDGMYSGKIVPGAELELSYSIYHYSRVDADPMNISRRVRNLDGLFHPDSDLIPPEQLLEYDFVPRTHDSFNTSDPPSKVEGVFEEFKGTHPAGVREWFSD